MNIHVRRVNSVNLRKYLPPGWVPVHHITRGQAKGSTRWMIYDPSDVLRGHLVRWEPHKWTWEPYPDGMSTNGTLTHCTAHIAALEA